MKITSETPEAERARMKVTRRDDFTDLPGLIVHADEQTGACQMKSDDGSTKDYELGQNGLAIGRRGR